MLVSGFNLVFGAFRGIIYYIIVRDFYEPEDVTPEEHWIEKKLNKFFLILMIWMKCSNNFLLII